MFTIEMFPAEYGDALWIEYGTPKSPHRVLVDAGKLATAQPIAERIREVAAQSKDKRCHFELMVLSHIDGDHIEGFLKLMNNIKKDNLPVEVRDIWFNGSPHLPEVDQEDEPAAPGSGAPDFFGGVQGEMLGAVLLDGDLPWNLWASGGTIFVPSKGPLPSFELPGGMKLTLLGPTFQRLRELRKRWDKDVGAWLKKTKGTLDTQSILAALEERPEGRVMAFGEGINVQALIDAKASEDRSEHNGSSIALLAEHDGKRAILSGDAFARDLCASIRRLLDERHDKDGKLQIDLFKIPHHGSRNNISEELLSLLDCDIFLVSTNGAVFGHPDGEAIARIVGGAGRRDKKQREARQVHVKFNYRSPETLAWQGKDEDGNPLPATWGFVPEYPAKDASGLKVTLR